MIKNKLFNLGILFGSVLVVILLLELALRFTHYSFLMSRNEEFRYYYKSDLKKGCDIKPNVNKFQSNVENKIYFPVWSNELGCFDDPYRGEKDYILLVGDSFVHGHAPFADKWGSQLEKLLGYRVLKCGVDGYGTKQEYLKAQEIIGIIKTDPRLIILGYFLNDLEDDYLFPRQTVIDGYVMHLKELQNIETGEVSLRENLEKDFSTLSSGSFIKIKNIIKRNSIIGRIFADFVKANIMSGPKSNINNKVSLSFFEFPWIENAWKNHFENIDLLKSLAIKNNAKLLIVIIPTREQVYQFLFDWQGARLNPETPNKKIINFLKNAGIGYVNLLPLLKEYANQLPRNLLSPSDDLYWQYDGHWSINGEHLAGLLVAKDILESKVIPITHRDDKLRLINQQLAEFRETQAAR